MSKIIQLPAPDIKKCGYKRAKTKKSTLEKLGQLNLFPGGNANILQFPSHLSAFERALIYDEGNNPKAKEAYLQAIDQDENVADAYCNLGIIESNNGNHLKAFDYFSNALQYDERHFETHYNMANLYFELDDLRLAQLHYEVSITIEPDFPNSYFNLALVFIIKKETGAAKKCFQIYKKLVTPEEASRADELMNVIINSLIKKSK